MVDGYVQNKRPGIRDLFLRGINHQSVEDRLIFSANSRHDENDYRLLKKGK